MTQDNSICQQVNSTVIVEVDILNPVFEPRIYIDGPIGFVYVERKWLCTDTLYQV